MLLKEPSEKEALTSLVLHWRLYGSLPTKDELAEYLSCEPNRLTVFLEDPEFQDKLVEKGVPTNNNPKLSPRQIQVIQILLNPTDGRSVGQKLDEAEISSDTYANWLKQPEFRSAMNKIGENNVDDSYPLILNKLTEKAVNGNQKSIEYLFEITGRYKKNEEVNPMLMMSKLLEIMSKHLGSHPEILMAISADLDNTIIKGELA